MRAGKVWPGWTWGAAVLLLSTLFAWQLWRNQQQQDRDMCAMISVFLSGPEPVAGPAGDRSRTVRAAMQTYYAKRGCPAS